MIARPRKNGAGSRITAASAAAALLAACTAPATKSAPPAPPVPLEASFDWHVLLAAPFGSLLKDAPLPLHEVLVFRDEAPGASSVDEGECFAPNGTSPRFLARQAEEFLLCYVNDRLSRIEATVRLPSTDAPQVFADACGLWMKIAPGQLEGACSGSTDGIAFSGHLETDADPAETALTVKLGPASPDR
jgi:hypothetical protein